MEKKCLRVTKVHGQDNVADVLTKPVGREVLVRHAEKLGMTELRHELDIQRSVNLVEVVPETSIDPMIQGKYASSRVH